MVEDSGKVHAKGMTWLVLESLRQKREKVLENTSGSFNEEQKRKLLKMWEEADLLSLHIMTLFDTLPNTNGTVDLICALIGVVDGITSGNIIAGIESFSLFNKEYKEGRNTEIVGGSVGNGGGGKLVH